MAIVVLQFQDAADPANPELAGVSFQAAFDPPVEDNPTPAQAEALRVLELYENHLKSIHGAEMKLERIEYGGESGSSSVAHCTPNDQGGHEEKGSESDAG